MVVFVLQNVEPPIIPNIFKTVLPLRGDAAKRARRYLASKTLASKTAGKEGQNGGKSVDAGSDSWVYRNVKELAGSGGRGGGPVLQLDAAGVCV